MNIPSKIFLVTLIISTLSYSVVSVAKDNQCGEKSHYKGLTSHGASYIGMTSDNDDVPFLDFTLAQKYLITGGSAQDYRFDCWSGFFAFTGRFGQYINNRHSSPVIGKVFNPELFIRLEDYGENFLQDKDDVSYIDIAYGHESNGQGLTELDQFTRQQEYHQENELGKEYFAHDYISRGWDYLGLTWKLEKKYNFLNFISALKFRYYLKDGLLQGAAENMYEWEKTYIGNEKMKDRKEVDGISWQGKMTTFNKKTEALFNLQDMAMSLKFSTGYKGFAKYISTRAEVTGRFMDTIPVTLWISSGYNNDLARYYTRNTSVGLAFELRTFLD